MFQGMDKKKKEKENRLCVLFWPNHLWKEPLIQWGQSSYKLSVFIVSNRQYKRVIVNYVRCDDDITITYKTEMSSEVHTEEFYNLVKK